MSAMKASWFGHLFSIPDLKFQGQLHNMLLRRLVNSSLKHLVLSFNINGRNLDFTPFDFAIITGLKFSPCSILPVESELHRCVFGSKCSITVDEIEKAFKAECRASAGCSELSLKLAFLLILFGILLVRGSRNKNVDMTYLHLADDIQMGEVAYDLVVRQTHRAKFTLDKLLRNDKRIQLDANGFSLVLQVWAYEVIPVVARNAAQKIECAANYFPRILRWIATKPIKFDIVYTYFHNVKSDTLHMLICPTDFEKQLLHVLGVYEIPSPLLKNNHQAQSVECGGSQPPATDVVEELVSVPLTEESLTIPNITFNDHVVSNLQRRVAKLEQYIHEMKTSRQIEVYSVRINRPGLRSGSSSAHMESNKPTVKSHMPKRSKRHIDALLNLLIIMAKKEPVRFFSRSCSMWHHTTLRSMTSTGSISYKSFCLPTVDYAEHAIIMIPQKFVSKDVLVIYLRGVRLESVACTHVWKVKIQRIDGNYYMTDGWNKFKTNNWLTKFDILKFEMQADMDRWEVWAYNAFGTKKLRCPSDLGMYTSGLFHHHRFYF
ncbi:hypothetical protein C2S53_008110 [Perilla frutescens var. hirtella]|uniref:TF-B3 domain-containing protein n=1 Tax=Perilla frutescens var. hirtella TaxID=608512 RepID=A0AAD4JG63_PERFH|nr:hypothetical protein C2S53_008110 [Perilla frutescens var. hirtella]